MVLLTVVGIAEEDAESSPLTVERSPFVQENENKAEPNNRKKQVIFIHFIKLLLQSNVVTKFVKEF